MVVHGRGDRGDFDTCGRVGRSSLLRDRPVGSHRDGGGDQEKRVPDRVVEGGSHNAEGLRTVVVHLRLHKMRAGESTGILLREVGVDVVAFHHSRGQLLDDQALHLQIHIGTRIVVVAFVDAERMM